MGRRASWFGSLKGAWTKAGLAGHTVNHPDHDLQQQRGRDRDPSIIMIYIIHNSKLNITGDRVERVFQNPYSKPIAQQVKSVIQL